LTLYEIAQDLLVAVVSALISPPSRQAVSPVRPPHECGHVIVWWEQGYPSEHFPIISREPWNHAQSTAFRLAVEVTRCIPQAKVVGEKIVPPSVAELNTSAQQIMGDAENIMKGMLVFAATIDNCNRVSIIDVEPSQASDVTGSIGRIIVAL
jgi:hypothetical protein